MMLEEGIKLHRFAGISPEQFLTEAGRHREAVVAADQRMVIRCFGDDLAGFVHDVFHGPPPIQPFSFERHDPPLPPRQRTPFAGGRNHHYSAFGASTAAGASAGASTAGASVGTASTAGAASGAFTSSTVGSSGVIAITPREVGENRRGHLP